MSKDLIVEMLEAVEDELRRHVARLDQPRTREFHEMMTYHLGWTGEGAGPEASGKRIRPLLLLLVNAAAGGDWRKALPAAAAVELIHNFSLIHDDIEDNSDLRRGRPTVWKRWGLAQGVNAGDGMFVLSGLAACALAQSHPPEVALEAVRILQETCLDLTRGQFLDISYEGRQDLTVEDYWPMIAGKTAALLAAAATTGALLAGVEESTRRAYAEFAHALGLAFQIRDDILGIWGDPQVTGKSAQSDLVAGKKSLPVLYGLERNGAFAKRWRQGAIRPEEANAMADLLAREGAQLRALQTADQLTDLALDALKMADPQGEAGAALHDLARKLLQRAA